MMQKPILLDIADEVATITLNRPANGNAINLELADALQQAMKTCEKERGVRAIVLRGAGKLFCSGGDLSAIASHGADASSYVRELLTRLHGAISAMARIPTPVVAGVNGAAAGAGLALACGCDLAIATESSLFVMAYSRVGLTPDGSSSFYLPRLIGLRRALQMALTNRQLTAREALDWGIVNEVVQDAALDSALTALVGRLVKGSPVALGGAKRLLRAPSANTLDQQLLAEMESICAALKTDDAKEGLSAFLEKRVPNFGN